jgi:hypothetical protein
MIGRIMLREMEATAAVVFRAVVAAIEEAVPK